MMNICTSIRVYILYIIFFFFFAKSLVSMRETEYYSTLVAGFHHCMVEICFVETPFSIFDGREAYIKPIYIYKVHRTEMRVL